MHAQEKQKLLARFQQMCAEKNDKIQIHDMAPVLDGVIEIIEDAINDNDRTIYDEVKNISGSIHDLKRDISSIQPENITNDHIPEATIELGEVVKSIENATNTILDTTEEIQNIAGSLTDSDQSQKIMDSTTKIFEACNFQDLTGQRISKVVSSLEYIEDTTKKLLALIPQSSGASSGVPSTNTPQNSREEQAKQGLLDGPQKESDAPSQDDIDKLFDSLD